jgi:hypothetical protein
MPGFDGTGPRGRGPMTGGGRGYCVLRLPRSANEPVEGFAGAAGRPIRNPDTARQAEAALLRRRVAELELRVRAVRDRITALQVED